MKKIEQVGGKLIERMNVKGGLVITLPLVLIMNLTPPSKFLTLIHFKTNLGDGTQRTILHNNP